MNIRFGIQLQFVQSKSGQLEAFLAGHRRKVFRQLFQQQELDRIYPDHVWEIDLCNPEQDWSGTVSTPKLNSQKNLSTLSSS